MMKDFIIKRTKVAHYRDLCGIGHKGAEVGCGRTCAKQAKVGGKGPGKGRVTAISVNRPTTRPVIGLDAFNLALAFCTPFPL